MRKEECLFRSLIYETEKFISSSIIIDRKETKVQHKTDLEERKGDSKVFPPFLITTEWKQNVQI